MPFSPPARTPLVSSLHALFWIFPYTCRHGVCGFSVTPHKGLDRLDSGLSPLSTPLLLGDDARKDTGFTVFIPSLGGGHLECFSFLTLINNAPVNMHIKVS